MDNETKQGFVNYRLEKAKTAFQSSNVLFNNNDFAGAMNRAYYAIFYAIRVVLAIEEIDFKRHKDVVAYFNKKYVNTEIFPKSIGRKIAQAQQKREDADYDDKYEISAEKTQEQINTAKEVIDLVEKYVKANFS